MTPTLKPVKFSPMASAAPSQPNLQLRKRLRPRTYSVTVYVVGFFIALEFALLAGFLYVRQSVVQIDTEAPELVGQEENPGTIIGNKGFSLLNDELPPLTSSGSRLSVPDVEDPRTQIADYIEQARRYRLAGKYDLADDYLKRSLKVNPKDGLTLTSLAQLEETRGRFDIALDYWLRVVQLGPEATDFQNLARERAAVLEDKLRDEKESSQRQEFLAGLKRDLSFGEIKSYPSTLPLRPEFFELSVPIKLNADIEIDTRKLRVQTFLYDRVPGTGSIVGSRNVQATFSQRPYWKGESRVEELKVTYNGSGVVGGERAYYYGYIFRVYYDGVLQDEHILPLDLAKRVAR